MTLPPNPTQSDLVRLSLLLCPSSHAPVSTDRVTRKDWASGPGS